MYSLYPIDLFFNLPPIRFTRFAEILDLLIVDNVVKLQTLLAIVF